MPSTSPAASTPAALPAPTDARLRFMNPPTLYDPAPNGYSHVAVIGAGRPLVLVSGQGGESADGYLSPNFSVQVRQGFANLRDALASAGAGGSDIAKLTVLIVDHDEEKLAVFGRELAFAFGETVRPTCTLVPVPRLALDGMLFEIEATAVIGA